MFRMSSFSAVSTVGVLLLLGAASPAAASSICVDDSFVLGDLLDGGSITVGDKLFDEFGYSATGDMPDAFRVNVLPFVDGNGNFGLRFQGGFFDLFGGGASDALITYQVTVLDPRFLISDVHLAGNPAVVGAGATGAVAVTETFLPDDPFITLSIFDIKPGSTQLVDFDFLTGPVQTLHVQKDILAIASTEGSLATLSFVDQTFSQVAAVPEPSTISLLILGLVAGWRLRRKSGRHNS